MPVNHHGGSASPPMTEAIESPVIFLLEVTWFSHRALAHLIVSGALERHPTLQLVFTEQGTAWIPDELMPPRLLLPSDAHAPSARKSTCGASRSPIGCR